jgi:hypothetical protein
MCGVHVKFKQLRNYLFNVLPKSMKGQRRDTKEILTTRSGTSSTHSGAGCQLLIAIARTSPSSAEPQLSDPPGFFFAAMPTKRTSQKSASEEGLGTASARRTSRPKLHCLVIQPDPSGGHGGHAKIKAQVGATRNKTTTHFISEGIAPCKGLAMNPNRKGGFDNKLPDGEAGERDIPPVVPAPVADMGDVGRCNDDKEINLAYLSFGSDTEKPFFCLASAQTQNTWQKRIL